jgi:hypothetical protein
MMVGRRQASASDHKCAVRVKLAGVGGTARVTGIELEPVHPLPHFFLIGTDRFTVCSLEKSVRQILCGYQPCPGAP